MSIWSRLERRINDFADGLVLDEHRDQVSQAKSLVTSGKHREAVELLDALLAVKPDHGQAWIVLGTAYLEAEDATLRDPEAAAKAFERAVAIRGNDATALLGLGLAQVQRVQLVEAAATLQKAIGEAGGDRSILGDAYRGLGIVWRRRNDFDKAVRELRKAVAEDTGDRLAHAALAEAMLATDASAEQITRHIEKALSQADASHGLALREAPALAVIAQATLALREGSLARSVALFDTAIPLTRKDHSPLGKLMQIDALLGHGDACLAIGDALTANNDFLQALQLDPKRAEIHGKVARAHLAVGNREAALASFDRALALATGEQSHAMATLLPTAVNAAIALGDANRQLQWGADLLVRDPDNVRGLVARGLGEAASSSQLSGSTRGLLELAASRGDIDARVGLARLLLPDHHSALLQLADALRLDPTHERAHSGLVEALSARFPSPTDQEIATLAQTLITVLTSSEELVPYLADVTKATATLDTPLLVTVMGEFSSGKSSFVNAFIGDDVAATGITPTTATINVVKYGHERCGRIYTSGSADDSSTAPLELPWTELFRHLHQLDAAAAAKIDRVEILVPVAALEKVHIVDTPGLNSILPEHEATARAFIAKADCVVWVFTANQGGKASERKALESIRNEGKRVLGVMNKADQLSPDEITEVMQFVQGTLTELVEIIVPVSARGALAAKQGKTGGVTHPMLGSDGNWQALHTALEQRFFSQARQLKRDACARQLRAVTTNTIAKLAAKQLRWDSIATEIRSLAQSLLDSGRLLETSLIVPERKYIVDQSMALYRKAAREVLELVRPRRLPFAAHSSTVADRDYLLSLLGDGYGDLLASSSKRVASSLRTQCEPVLAAARTFASEGDFDVQSDLRRVVEHEIQLATAAVFERANAYLSGYLAGGYVESFFRNDVPKLDLVEDAVFHALFRNAADLDRLVGEALQQRALGVLRNVAGRLHYWAGIAAVRRKTIERGALRSVEEVVARL